MNILAKVSQGRKIRPQIITIYGTNGVGKSTWASKFPQPLFADLENGSYNLDVSRLVKEDLVNEKEKIDAYKGFCLMIDGLLKSSSHYQTLVVDSVEALEGILSDYVCKEGDVDSIEKYDGGFGKGYYRTRELMRDLMYQFRKLADEKGITVILVGHSQVKQTTDPAENTTYDRHIMRCNDKMASIIRDLSDNVFFASHKVSTMKDQGKTRAFSDGQRVMFTEWRAGFDAKNRLNLPFDLPLSYDAYISAIENSKPKNETEIKAEIIELMRGLDAETKPKAQQALSNAKSIEELTAIKQRVQTLAQAA